MVNGILADFSVALRVELYYLKCEFEFPLFDDIAKWRTILRQFTTAGCHKCAKWNDPEDRRARRAANAFSDMNDAGNIGMIPSPERAPDMLR